jgi:hypothetical protein
LIKEDVMSSNSQIHIEPVVAASVRGSSAVSVAELLGERGAARMAGLLERLPEIAAQLPAAQRPEFDWQPAGDRAWRTHVDGHEVRLDLRGAVAELTVSGTRWVPEGTQVRLDPGVMSRAEQRLNNLLALVVAAGVSQRLSGYVMQKAGTKVTQKIQLKAVETVKNRVALRATTALKMRVR